MKHVGVHYFPGNISLSYRPRVLIKFFTNLLHSPKETPKKSDYYFMFIFRYIIKYPLHTQVTMLQLQCQGYCGNFRLEIRGLACASP